MGLKIYLLGEFKAVHDDETQSPIEWPRKQTQQLFKILVSQRGEMFSQDQLLDMLFPDLDPERGIGNLHKRMSELRKALEPDRPRGQASRYIESPSQGNYRFSSEAECWIDIEIFKSHIGRGKRLADQSDYSDALEEFERALELYQGDFLREDLYEEWTQLRRSQLREHYIKLLSSLAESALQLGLYEKALATSKRIITEVPGHEDAYSLKMRAHFYAGESQKALATYEQCERDLKIELGMTPSPELHHLYIDILNGILPKIRPAVANNLPRAMSSFVGRERALDEIKSLLSQHALVTLTGMGGAGKTRLSQKTAEEVMSDFPDGVWLLELASISDPLHLEPLLAQILNIREDKIEDLGSKIQKRLSQAAALVILDNCEHMIEASAALAEELLKNCHKLKILATSREALGIMGEVSYAVPSLTIKTDDPVNSEAVRLFGERARAIVPEFRLDEVQAAQVLELCTQLDGIPLAIELAAAQLKSLSLSQILERMGDRFGLLGQSSRTALPHHQTLRAMMDWSYELLSDHECHLLQRLSVFRGGFSLEAAEAICTDESLSQNELIHVMRELISKSLVLLIREDSTSRYDLLDTVRHYAQEKLNQDEADALQRRHLEYYLQLSQASTIEMKGEIEAEIDNVRAALIWAFSSHKTDIQIGAELLVDLRYYWFYRGSIQEGLKWFERLEALHDQLPEALLCWVKMGHAILIGTQRDREPAFKLLESALQGFESIDDKKGLVDTFQIQSAMHCEFGDFQRALEINEKSIALSKEIDDVVQYRSNIHNQGVMFMRSGNLAQAREHFNQALQLSKRLESNFGIGWASVDLALIDIFEANLDSAERYIKDAEAIALDNESTPDLVEVYSAWGTLELARKNFDDAERYFLKCLRLHYDMGSLVEISETLESLAYVNIGLERFDSAAEMLRAAHQRRTDVQIPIPPIDLPSNEQALEQLRQAMGESEFKSFWNERDSQSIDVLIAQILLED